MAQAGTRREREKLRHRDEILAAAETLFAQKGFHGTTVEEVAARAEFAVGTVYNFFPSKDDLYRSLLQIRCEQLAAEGNALLDCAEDPLAEVRASLRYWRPDALLVSAVKGWGLTDLLDRIEAALGLGEESEAASWGYRVRPAG